MDGGPSFHAKRLLFCEDSEGKRFVLKLAAIWREKGILVLSLNPRPVMMWPSEQERDTINCVEYEWLYLVNQFQREIGAQRNFFPSSSPPPPPLTVGRLRLFLLPLSRFPPPPSSFLPFSLILRRAAPAAAASGRIILCIQLSAPLPLPMRRGLIGLRL